MVEKQKSIIPIYEKLLKELEEVPPGELKKLESAGFVNLEIFKIRLEILKLADKAGMYFMDWLRAQCKLILSDHNYMKLLSEGDRNALSDYHSRLSMGIWCDEKDDLLFHRLRKKYQEFISKKTSTYTS